MAFIQVFVSLQEIFPQIDLRILRAVAIEHPNDVDAAVESILVDVLPSLTNTVGFDEPPHALSDNNRTEHSSTLFDTAIVEKDEQPTQFGHQEVGQGTSNHPSGQEPVAFENTVSSVGKGKQPMLIDQDVETDTSLFSGQGSYENTISNGSSASLRMPYAEEADCRDLQVGLYSNGPKCPTWNNNVVRELHILPESEQSFLGKGIYLNSDAEDILLNSDSRGKEVFMDASNQINVFLESCSSVHNECPLEQPLLQHSIEKSEALIDVSHRSAQTLSEPSSSVAPAFNGDSHIASMESSEMNSEFLDNKEKGEDWSNNVHVCKEQSVTLVQPSNLYNLPELEANATVSTDVASSGNTEVLGEAFLECGVDKLTLTSEFENPQFKLADEDAADLLSFESNIPTATDDNVPATLLSQSGHSAIIDHLEDLISDAESNKKNMFSAIEVTTNMMREVELLQERSEQAKKAASSAGQDILSKVEELKKILKHAKEANDMHSGEVYGEKAILATECRELQSRLLSLSDGKNKSLSVIEEIRKTLEARAAAMEEEIAKAEQEKLEKEALAYVDLREQESIMASVVEESKKLQQEAEMNSKLRNFLMDRGCMVDALQGEIAVICEDVMLLKEIVDGHVPLGRSLHLTASSLSSSASSSYYRTKHSSSDGALDNEEDFTDKPLSPEHVQTKVDLPEKSGGDHPESPTDDGWEILKEA